MKFRLVCFDFDGTLADTMPFLENLAVRLLVEKIGMDENTARKKYRETTGLPFVQQVDLIARHASSKDKKSLVEQFETQKKEQFLLQELFVDTKRKLKELRHKGLKIAISSSTDKKLIDRYIKNKAIDHLVDVVCGYRPGFEKGKDHFKYLIHTFNLVPAQILFVGDSLQDMERAHLNEVGFIGKVSRMFGKEDFVIRKGKITIFPTIVNLSDLVDLV